MSCVWNKAAVKNVAELVRMLLAKFQDFLKEVVVKMHVTTRLKIAVASLRRNRDNPARWEKLFLLATLLSFLARFCVVCR